MTTRIPDGLPRCVGMGIGALTGWLLLILLSYFVRIDQKWLLALPGIAVGIGCGAFSFSRRIGWGVVAAAAGCLWTLFILWLQHPRQVGFVEQARILATSWPGLLHGGIIVACGVTVGAGWTKAPLQPDEDGPASG